MNIITNYTPRVTRQAVNLTVAYREEDLNKQFKTNLHGQSAVTRAFLPYLQEQKGKVVFISSFTSTNVVPAAGAYCVSKGGLDSK